MSFDKMNNSPNNNDSNYSLYFGVVVVPWDQRRMRPEIADLIKETLYPNLFDSK